MPNLQMFHCDDNPLPPYNLDQWKQYWSQL